MLHPVPEARVYCQGANYRSHMVESGMDPDRAFNMLFTKASASLTAADAPSRPAARAAARSRGRARPRDRPPITGPATAPTPVLPTTSVRSSWPTTSARATSNCRRASSTKARATARSARSARTSCVPGPGEVARWRELRLTLSVNGQPRQDALAADMVFQPAATLTEFSQLEDFQVGDLLLTGTPGGVALQPPKAVAQRIVGLLPEAKRRELFVPRPDPRSTAYLKPGDRVTASIRTADGGLDLGTQHNRVR